MADIQNVHYEHIRTFEVVSQTVPSKEVLVTFQEGSTEGSTENNDDAEEVFGERPKRRRKGVYFNQITMRTLLRKTRAKVSAYNHTIVDD